MWEAAEMLKYTLVMTLMTFNEVARGFYKIIHCGDLLEQHGIEEYVGMHCLSV